jgi:hypothetical protein
MPIDEIGTRIGRILNEVLEPRISSQDSVEWGCSPGMVVQDHDDHNHLAPGIFLVVTLRRIDQEGNEVYTSGTMTFPLGSSDDEVQSRVNAMWDGLILIGLEVHDRSL